MKANDNIISISCSKKNDISVNILSDLPVCARCATINPTCCSMSQSNGDIRFPLSKADLVRMEPHVAKIGKTLEDFIVSVPNSPVFLKAMRVLFSGEGTSLLKAFPEGEKHFVLACAIERNPEKNMKAREDIVGSGLDVYPDASCDTQSDCTLLGHAGCTLPVAARPLYCRLFPFWVRNWRKTASGEPEGIVDFFVSPSCLAAKEARMMEKLYDIFQISPETIKDTYAMLREEWGLPYIPVC